MNRKLTPAYKNSEAPRRARVRVQESELLRKHSLTLIGKVTNRSVQKVPSLIPFLTEYWKKQEISTVGSDLGQGLFQFQFDSESDLLAVLENRPFHFAKWMVILQRWEPTISPSFPSLIPFWIKVEGIPAHLCSEETIRSIGEDIGHFECLDIISSAVRMRVHVNGRLPLIKSSVIEYPNGDEVTASLVYERLEKHCSHCYRLDHELKDCLAAKHQKKKAISVQQDKEEQSSSVVTTEEKSSHGGPCRYDNLQTRRSSYSSKSIKWVPKDDQRRSESRDSSKVVHSQSARGIPHDSLPPEALGHSSCSDRLESAASKERLRQAEEQGELGQTKVDATTTVPLNSHNGISKQQKKKKNTKSRTNGGDNNAAPPQAGVSLNLASLLPAKTSQPESRQTMLSGTSTTVPQYNGGEAPPQAWQRDSQTVHDDASNQSFQLYLYNTAGQLPPPPPPRYYSSGGNMQYQGQGQSLNMPQNNYAHGSSNHPVSHQPMTQLYQPEASVQNQNYGPVSSYQQANNYHGVTTNRNPSRCQATMQPASDKANLEPQRQAAQPMLSGDVEKDERYQKTLEFAASLLHQIKQSNQQQLSSSTLAGHGP